MLYMVLCLKYLFPQPTPLPRLPGLEGVRASGCLREQRPKHALASAWEMFGGRNLGRTLDVLEDF